ncbi:hypothetical protein Tco_0708876, partial [Tanacetum coccineum]
DDDTLTFSMRSLPIPVSWLRNHTENAILAMAEVNSDSVSEPELQVPFSSVGIFEGGESSLAMLVTRRVLYRPLLPTGSFQSILLGVANTDVAFFSVGALTHWRQIPIKAYMLQTRAMANVFVESNNFKKLFEYGFSEFVIRAAAEKHLHTYNDNQAFILTDMFRIPSIGGLFFLQEIPHHPFSWYVIPQHAVNLDDPNQKMVHPIPATLGTNRTSSSLTLLTDLADVITSFVASSSVHNKFESKYITIKCEGDQNVDGKGS